MSGNQWFDSNPTGYGEHWFTPGDDPEQFAQQQLAQEQLSMPITEPDEPTDHYVPNPASASGHYMFSDPNWQLHHDPGYYQQPIQYSFLQDTIPPFDLEVSQPEIFEPVAISRPLPDQHDPGQSQAMERRLSLQPPQPQTPSAYNRERSASLTTPGWSSPSDTTQPGMISRTASPGAAEPEQYGYPVDNGLWKCSYPACKSSTVFRRACDLRKHYKRHFKRYFCSYPNCQHHSRGGFSSKKDCDRHEASHNPSIPCSHPGCVRTFSRVDNMRDHVKRIHDGPSLRTRRGTS